MGDLDEKTDADALRAHFAQFGNVEEAFVVRGRRRGFVTFADEEAMSKALTAKQSMDGNTIYVAPAKPCAKPCARPPAKVPQITVISPTDL